MFSFSIGWQPISYKPVAVGQHPCLISGDLGESCTDYIYKCQGLYSSTSGKYIVIMIGNLANKLKLKSR